MKASFEGGSHSCLLEKHHLLFISFLFFCILRDSCLEVFFNKGVLKNFAKFTGKHLCQSIFLLNTSGGYFIMLTLVIRMT